MARRWLEVTTDEVRSNVSANERLAARREAMVDRVWPLIETLVEPAMQAAAQRLGDREYRVAGDSELAVAKCGIYAPGSVEHDPRVAFHEAEFDAYQPLVVLRSKADGAGEPVHASTLHLERLDQAALDDFLAGSS